MQRFVFELNGAAVGIDVPPPGRGAVGRIAWIELPGAPEPLGALLHGAMDAVRAACPHCRAFTLVDRSFAVVDGRRTCVRGASIVLHGATVLERAIGCRPLHDPAAYRAVLEDLLTGPSIAWLRHVARTDAARAEAVVACRLRGKGLDLDRMTWVVS